MNLKNYLLFGLFLYIGMCAGYAQCGVKASDDVTIVCGEEARLDAYSKWSGAIDSTSAPFMSIFFTDTEIGYAVNESGGIHKTIDGGKTWASQISGTSDPLVSVFFTDANTGFIIDNPHNSSSPIPILLKTTNGGVNWTPQVLSVVGLMYQILFTNASTGFIVGQNGTITKTTDGGASWTKKTTNTTAWISSIYFLDANNGYAGGNECMLKTTDGGETWSVLPGIYSVTFNAIYFTDVNTGFAAGNNGNIYKTINGGTTWISTNVFSGGLNAVHFTDANTGYVAGNKIWKTVDAGKTWLSSAEKEGYLLDLCFPSPKIGYATGQGTFKYIAADSYSWSPAAGLDASNVENPIAAPSITTTYKVTAITGTCAAVDSVTVTVNPLTADAGPDKILTCGGSVQLNTVTTNYKGAGTLLYSWFPTSGLNATNISNPVATVTQNTKFYVMVTTPNGCTDMDSVNVIVNPLTADAGGRNKGIICGSTVQLDNITTNYMGTGSLTYSWSPTAGLNSASISNPIASPVSTTLYKVTISTPNGCVVTDSVLVNVFPLTIDAMSNKTVTCGGSAQLDKVMTSYTGSGKLTYSWLPNDGLNASNIPDPIASPTHTTKYYIEVTSPTGCLVTDSVMVFVDPLTVSAGSNKTIICKGTTQFDAVTTNYTGTTPLIYSWQPTTGLNHPDVANPEVIAPGTYTVTVATVNGCIAHDEIVVSQIKMDPIEICMVGADSTGKNNVIWNKPSSDAIDSIFVYRETTVAGKYIKIGSVSNSKNVFKDLTSFPEVKSNKYKISVLDSCGFETSQSAYHKTMHLSITKGIGTSWNLIWENYEGFSVPTYNIYRGTNQNDLQFLDATSGGSNQYTNYNPPPGDLYYQVEVVNPNPCTVTSLTGPLRSNVARNGTTTGIYEQENEKLSFMLYPNPATDFLAFSVENIQVKNASLTIYNTLGAIVKTVLLEQNKQQINVSDLNNGFYTIEIKSATYSGQQKLIIQK